MSNSGDFIDYTALQKRGLLKKVAQPVEEKNEYASFMPAQETPSKVPSLFTEPLAPALPQAQENNPFAFLDSLASSTQVQETQVAPRKTDSLDTTDLAIKLENLEYKIERFIERLAQVEDKIEKFRAKIG